VRGAPKRRVQERRRGKSGLPSREKVHREEGRDREESAFLRNGDIARFPDGGTRVPETNVEFALVCKKEEEQRPYPFFMRERGTESSNPTSHGVNGEGSRPLRIPKRIQEGPLRGTPAEMPTLIKERRSWLGE